MLKGSKCVECSIQMRATDWLIGLENIYAKKN